MLEFRRFVQRRRKMLAQLCALFAVAVGGAFALMPLPYADASDTRRAAPQVAAIKLPRGDAMGLLLSPAPLSSERFLSYYAIAYR